jgi:predicted nucleic acid-binding protein
MRNKAHDTATYSFQQGEKILLDANIWLFLHPPVAQPPPYYSRKYSAALKKLLTAGAQPVVETLVLSEYLNRYLRLEFDVSWRGQYPKFKDFRRSTDFQTVAKDAVAEARQILKLAVAEDTPLAKADLTSVLTETETGSFDFNDGILVETCRLQGWKLLTDDSDMKLGGIEVLTSNPRLLAACP